MRDDISFLIALRIDSEDRISNLDISTSYLKYHFPNSEIILSEIDDTSKIKDRYKDCTHIFTESKDFFCKTKAYNIAANNSKKPVLCLYDADVILKDSVIEKCAELLRKKEVDILYPYNGNFYDVPKEYHKTIDTEKKLDCVDLAKCNLLNPRSYGGAVFIDRNVFFDAGGTNENINIGYEDDEIYYRYQKLGYRMGRLNTVLHHLNHERTITSFENNPHAEYNKTQFYRILNMNKQELLQEVTKWKNER